MPVIETSTYKSPFLLNNGHIQSMYPILFRKIKNVNYMRETINTPDNDFIDLDWSRVGTNSLVVILHGLEGNSYRPYIKGMVKTCNQHSYDTVAINFRGCSGKPNKLLKSYHQGSSEDLHIVINHLLSHYKYRNINIVGFSLGGNVTLKYLGENIYPIPKIINKVIAISVPNDLESCAIRLAKKSNKIYMNYFLKMLHEKIKAKIAMFPDKIDDKDYKQIRTFKEFDDKYTAPINGFRNAKEYWDKCSSKQFLTNIKIPTLLINAKNDPFLTKKCFPINESIENKNLFLETPKSGGHVGFINFNKNGEYWHERRCLQFIKMKI